MLKKSATYFLGNFLASLIGFGGLMVITRLIAPSDYGVFSYVSAITLMAYPFFFTWLKFAILREQSANRVLDLRKTILISLLLIFSLIVICVLSAAHFAIDFKGYHFFVIFMIFFIGLYEIILEFVRAHQKEKHYVAIVVNRSLIYIITALACYYLFPNHALGLVIAFCLSYLIVIFIGFSAFLYKPLASLERVRIKKWIIDSPAPTIIALCSTIVTLSDRFFITYFLDITSLGQFVVSSDLTKQFILAPAAAFTAVFMNKAIETFHTNTSGEFEAFMQKSFTMLLAIMLPIVFGLNLIGSDAANYLIGEKYSSVSHQIIPFLAFGIFFNMLSNYYFHAIYHAKKLYKPIIYQLILSLILNCVFMVIFIKPYGLKGAAIAFMCAEGLGVILSYIFSRRLVKLTLFTKETWQIIAINLALTAAMILLTLIDHQSIFKIISIILIYAISYFAIIIKLNLFNSKDIIQAAIKRL